jgi:hypothetical protein
MRRLLIITLLGLLPGMAAAQRWSGQAARAVTARPAMSRRAPMARPWMARPMPGMRAFPARPNLPARVAMTPQWRRGFRPGRQGFRFGHFPFGVAPQNRCFSDAFFDPFFCTRRPTFFSSFAPFGFSPFYSVPYLYADTSDNYSTAAAEQVERANAQASDLASQVQQLREELERLREQQSAAAMAPPAEPAVQAAPPEPAVPTTLVFRDGRRSEVENYAIVGNTLWVFNDVLRKKIPINQLDLDATQRVNENRGVEFLVPPATK